MNFAYFFGIYWYFTYLSSVYCDILGWSTRSGAVNAACSFGYIWERNILVIYSEFRFFFNLSILYLFIIDLSIYFGMVNMVGGQCGMWSNLKNDFFTVGLEPRQKVCNALSRPLGQVCSLLYKLHQINIYSNSTYKHN